MTRRRRGSRASARREDEVLARLGLEESAGVLRLLLEKHPELVPEAQTLALQLVAKVGMDVVAEEVREAVLGLDLEDLNARAGRHEWGYVDPSEAAWELLEEAIDPFIAEVRRHIDLGCEAAATETCAGIVLGLYACRGQGSDRVLGWAEDFLAESASDAVATLEGASRAKQKRAWRLPSDTVDRVPQWAVMLRHVSRPTAQRR